MSAAALPAIEVCCIFPACRTVVRRNGLAISPHTTLHHKVSPGETAVLCPAHADRVEYFTGSENNWQLEKPGRKAAPEPAKPSHAEPAAPDTTPEGLCHECGEFGKYTLTVTSKFNTKRTVCGKCMGYYATQVKYSKWAKSQYQKNG